MPVTIAIAQSGKDNFYSAKIIPQAIALLLIPANQFEAGVLQIGNTLIVTDVDSESFQKISPIAGYLLIKHYFPDRKIKTPPKISLMDKSEYQSFRKKDFDERLLKFDDLIEETREDIGNLPGEIESIELQIERNKATLEETGVQKEKEYAKCVNEGYYKSGVYYKVNSKEFCLEKISYLEDLLKETKQEGTELEWELKQVNERLGEYQSMDELYTNQKLLTQEEKKFISYEFASFEQPDTIKVSLAMRDTPPAAADLLELIVHEYLHYNRFGEEKRLGSVFLRKV